MLAWSLRTGRAVFRRCERWRAAHPERPRCHHAVGVLPRRPGLPGASRTRQAHRSRGRPG